MTDAYESLCYHGRRSVAELVGARDAAGPAASLVHRELSRLHLDRFVAMMRNAADYLPAPAGVSEGQAS